MPFIMPSDAAFIAPMMSSYDAPFSMRAVKSTTETSEVGTRNDMPVSLPFSSGSTCATLSMVTDSQVSVSKLVKSQNVVPDAVRLPR